MTTNLNKFKNLSSLYKVCNPFARKCYIFFSFFSVESTTKSGSKIIVESRRTGGGGGGGGGKGEWEKAVPEKKSIVHLKRTNLSDDKGGLLFYF